MTNLEINVSPVYYLGAFYVTIDGETAHIPFTEVTPHVSELLKLLDRASVEEPHISGGDL